MTEQTKHPSHDTRSSDASSYDEVCKNCGATDISGGGWGKLAEPCSPMTTTPDAELIELALARYTVSDEHGTRGEMTNDEFCARFKNYMLKAGETFDDGESIAEYADEAAVAYWDDPMMTNDSPEACAAADMDYWGD